MTEETSFQRAIREFRESNFVNFQKFLDHRKKEREKEEEKDLDSEKEE